MKNKNVEQKILQFVLTNPSNEDLRIFFNKVTSSLQLYNIDADRRDEIMQLIQACRADSDFVVNNLTI